MPSEVVRDAILPRVTLATGKRSSGYLAVPVWSTARAGGAMIWRTSRGANRNRWGVCERALQPPCHGKASRGKPGPKPESGNPTFRDCRGARGNVTSSL